MIIYYVDCPPETKMCGTVLTNPVSWSHNLCIQSDYHVHLWVCIW
jgi:hypothetical protein